jgi:hypothetical protein
MASPGTAVTTHVSSPPASSPPDSYDPVLVSQPSSANRSPSSVIKRLDDIFGASEHLPVPRTPANPRHRQPSPASELPDYASEYYTAAWGSPYQLSPSSILSQSARTAVSEQAQSDRFTNSSPGPSFSLEHLIPSRFNEPPSVTSHPSLEIPSAYPQEEDTEHTPRSRTKRWAQVPYRPLPRSQWYSDDSVFTARSRDVSVSTRASSGTRAARGHKTREENRTLDQQSFWNILQETKEPNMSTLQSSRWAATPSEEETPVKAPVWQDSTTAGYFDGKPLPQPPSEDDELPVETPRAAEDSGIEKTEPEPEQQQEQEPEQQPPSIEVSEEEPIKDVPQEQKPADLVKPMPEVARLAPPKLRKRVSWRGKNCIISIPRLDYEALGLMKPMSSEDFQQRLKDFEDEGYDTRGFDLGHVLPGNESSMHAKPIWPDEADMKVQTSIKESHNVKLPNLRLWADYMDALTEARLAALGVSLGDDEPAPLSAQEASRQGSGQFSPSLFSPPGSAASLGRPGMIRGHSHTMSMASPISPLNGPFGHMHRHSTFHGAFPGFVSPAQQQQDLQQRQTPIPGLGNFSPLTQNHLSRVGSPLQVTALRNELGGLRGPGSPLSNQMTPQTSQDYSRGMIEDQRRRQHGYSQSVQVPSMARNFSPQTGRTSVGPQYALPELPEDEEDEEEEDEDPLAYVAPVERQKIQNQIAIPTPRGHRHNISEGLEREVLEAEQRRQPEDARPFGGFGQPAQQKPMVNSFNSEKNGQQHSEQPTPPEEKDPLSGDFVVAESARGHRKTGTRANIAPPVTATAAAPAVPKATSLRFNPTAEFQPGAAAFSFGAGAPQTSFAPPVADPQPVAFSFGTGAAQPAFTAPIAQPQPSAAAFSFGAGTTQPDFSANAGHSRQKSSGHFNPAAITFEPGNPSTVPSSGFSFSSNGPAFVPDAPVFQPNSTGLGSSEENKIFGKVAIPEIVKPSKKSAAVPILVPVEMSRNGESGTEVEDSDGRTVRKNERQKRQRALGGDDGDEVPQFAEPTPLHLPILPTQPEELYPVAATPDASPKMSPKKPTIKEIEAEAIEALNAIAAENKQSAKSFESEAIEALNAIAAENKQNAKSSDENAAPATAEQPAYQRGHKKSNSSLSAMAPPFVFHGAQASRERISSPIKSPAKPTHVPQASISELEEGEILEDEPQSDVAKPALGASNERSEDRDSTASLSEPLRPHNLPESLDTSDDPRVEPTFDEIDAIMQQMNDVEAEPTASPNKDVLRAHSPNLLQPANGVTYLPGWPRSDAPSPSPKRLQPSYQQHNDSSFTAHDRSDSGELHGMNGWPPQRINKDDEVPHSDWSGLLSPIDEDKLQSRSMFFDSHIDSIIGRVVDRRLQPLENSLRAIQSTVSKRARSSDQQLTLKPRSSSIAESDADDEDDVNDSARNRPVSRGRDQKLSQIKAIVMEAIREQGPASGQSYHDIADLHSALADMKVSFARAASASLELEDIRLIVEEAVKRQPPAISPVEKDDSELSTRQISEMQGRLDETLANALEDANHRQQAEAREADVRRMLKLAEEELKLLRESSQDDDARLHALEQERQELRHRAESAERAQEDADERCQSMEAEHEAMQATLEEYRTSSNKWRQEIEETKSERDELETAVGLLEQRLQSDQDAASREKIELENTVSELEQRLQYEQDAGKREKAELEVTIAELELRLESERKAGKLAKGELENQLAELEQRLQNERWDGEREKAALASTVLELERHSQAALEDSKRDREELENTIAALERQFEDSKRDREELENTIAALERQFEDTQDSGNGMRRRLEKLHSDMATAAGQLASEKASWKNLEEEYLVRFEELEAQNNAYSQEKAALEEEVSELRTVAAEATDAKLALDNLRSSKSSLDEMVRKQQAEIREQQVEIREQQALAARFERDYQDARESARAEIQRTRMSLETDVEAANHQVNIVRAQYDSELARVRAEYESEISRVRTELDNVRMDADTAKERYAIQLEAESDSKREALRKVNHDNSVALDKARHNYEAAVQDLKVQHSRALRHATEDKDRSEYFLNERLRLADAKLEHFQDRVVHLEERLEVTKSAAQAAAMSAQSKSSQAVTSNSRSTIPEKVSPQALRESILVLQEQLQERESRIEQLQNKVKVEGPEKIKERDTEIAWLRELLGVRSEELTELINALSRPTFDRETVRDTAIRIRANLQMEQQEKERFGQNGSLPGQALASLTSFATPKAASLFNKWRSSMESTTLKAQQSRAASAAASRSNTPSRPSVSARVPPSYKAGLMTPPATNLRSSPAPEATRSLPAPALGRAESRDQKESAPAEPTSNAQGKQPMTDFTAATEDPSTPPEEFTANEFDQDAPDAHSQIPDFDDDPTELEAEGDESLDDLDDSRPPAFRSLEEEMEDESTIAGGEEEGA